MDDQQTNDPVPSKREKAAALLRAGATVAAVCERLHLTYNLVNTIRKIEHLPAQHARLR